LSAHTDDPEVRQLSISTPPGGTAVASLIGQTVSHYEILEKSRPGLCSGRSSFCLKGGTGLGESQRGLP